MTSYDIQRLLTRQDVFITMTDVQVPKIARGIQWDLKAEVLLH